jgi:Xaa-Pro aminopeptidase
MVHSVEPRLYDPDLGGVRIEDIVLDTNDGLKGSASAVFKTDSLAYSLPIESP